MRITGLCPGAYVLVLEGGGERMMRRFVKR